MSAWRRHDESHSPRNALPIRARFLAIFLVAVGLAVAAKVGAASVLENGDFESNWDHWTVFSPVSWNYYVESQEPNHSGSRVFKAFGCWCSGTGANQAGVYQDVPSAAGSTYTAAGWIFSRSSDHIAGNNSAWYQVEFQGAGDIPLARYRSGLFTTDDLPDTWLYYDVTNQVDVTTGEVTGSASVLTAPAGTVKVRFTVMHQQISDGGGAVHYDDAVLDQLSGPTPPTIVNISPSGTALFNSSAGGFTFNAVSASGSISPEGISVVLNGLDITPALVITGPSNNRSVAYNGLKADRVYTADIDVVDGDGLFSAATVTFDTFSAANFVWEAEDYDFSGGSYINHPVVTSTNNPAISYFGQTGVAEIDFHDPSWGGNADQAYRAGDVPGPGTEWCGDLPRQKYLDAVAGGDVNAKDYDLGWTYDNGTSWTGDWANYTRNFPTGTYNIYGRLSGGGGASKVAIWKVTSGAGTYDQTTSLIGQFLFNSHGWQAYDWVPLTDAEGNLVAIPLTGVTTLRVAGDNANHNFFMLAPARDDQPLISGLYPAGQHPFEPTNTLAFNVSSAVATIPTAGIQVMLDGNDVSPLLTIGSNATNRSVTLAALALNATHTATISVTDSAGTFVSRKLVFDTFSESNLMFEAEDYDFGSGQYISSPVLSTTPGADNYYGQSVLAVEGVDISTNLPASGYHSDYLRVDIVGTEPTLDYQRQAYVTAQGTDPSVSDYNVGWWMQGSWLNYTRNFPAGNYSIYARLAGPAAFTASIARVTAGGGTENQTTAPIGNFAGRSTGWQVWTWVPAAAATNEPPATVSLSGVTTLRVTTQGELNAGYYMLIPAKMPVTLTAVRSAGDTVISFPSQSGASYTIQYKDSLVDSGWQFLTILLGDGNTKTITDTTATGAQRFYRAVIQ